MKNIKETPLWTALITPLNTDFTVDYLSLEKILRQQESAKNGVLILGSTGEALNLSLKDRKEIIDFTLSLKLSVPLMVGVGGSDLEATLDWIGFLNSKNLDYYLCVTPLYAKPGDVGQFNWFKALLDEATSPCVLYNVPGRTACSLSLRALEMLLSHKNFVGIKEASGTPEKFFQYVQVCKNKALFCGDDGLMPKFADLGSCGLISVASNVWPDATQLYVRKALAKSLSPEEKILWKEAADTLFEASNPVPVKCLMNSLGMIDNNTLKQPLCSEDLHGLALQTQANANIAKWHKSTMEKR
ncbi:4-hydroxy-tetrahydrodipicolinate synthase [bacterium]|nr:4-hydroxy-tetrahydrodipicolinate synthase [bacterium]